MSTQHTPGPDHVRLASYESAASAIGCSCVLTRNSRDGMIVLRLCPTHAAAPGLLVALEGFREDPQTRLDAATDGMTEADGLVLAEDVNRSWRAWLFDVMRTHGDVACAAIVKAREYPG